MPTVKEIAQALGLPQDHPKVLEELRMIEANFTDRASEEDRVFRLYEAGNQIY